MDRENNWTIYYRTVKVLGKSEYNPNNPMPLSGVEYHRQYMPFQYMSHTHDFTFKYAGSMSHQDGTPIDLSEFDLYTVVRKDVKVVNNMWEDAHNITKAKEYGLPVVIDFDDLWRLDSTHALYKYYKDNKVAELSLSWIERADAVTCTTERLASHIRKHHSNVTILPNCIHPLLEQFSWNQADLEPRAVPNIGWIGSAHHVNDIAILYEYFRKYWNSPLSKSSSMVMGGYVEGQLPHKQMASIMSGGGLNPLQVLGVMQVDNYAKMYQHIDIAIVPLADNEFNRCKSELKLIEAGHFGIPVIASDVYPYNTVIEHGVDGFLIKNAKDCHKQWLKYTTELVNDPSLRYHMGQNLRHKILNRFNINDITKKRFELYSGLCRK